VQIVSTFAAGAANPIRVFDTVVDTVSVVVAVLESPDMADALTPNGRLSLDFMGRHHYVKHRGCSVHFIQVIENDTCGAQVLRTLAEARRNGRMSAGDAFMIFAPSEACCRGVLEAIGLNERNSR
jgi:hypothetical protein